MAKKLTGFGPNCAGGQAPWNDGRMAQKVGQPGQPHYLCTLCQREFAMVNGRIPQHVYELKLTNVAVGDKVPNSQANLAARAFNRTRGKA
jgi:hypothetical protein